MTVAVNTPSAENAGPVVAYSRFIGRSGPAQAPSTEGVSSAWTSPYPDGAISRSSEFPGRRGLVEGDDGPGPVEVGGGGGGDLRLPDRVISVVL